MKLRKSFCSSLAFSLEMVYCFPRLEPISTLPHELATTNIETAQPVINHCKGFSQSVN